MFYVLMPSRDDETSHVYGVVNGEDEPIWSIERCNKCNLVKMKKQINDLRIELFGDVLSDIVWTDDDPLVTKTVASRLNSSNLKGFRLRPGNIVSWWWEDKCKKEIFNIINNKNSLELFQLDVFGFGGNILSRELHMAFQCADCHTTQYDPLKEGFQISIEQWDGSNIFKIKEFPGYMVIDQIFLDWLEKYNIRNYRAIPTREFSMI
jgi:hypothetical protein